MPSRARRSAELQAGNVGSPLERRKVVPAAVDHEEPARRNAVPAVVEHEERARRNVVPAVVEGEEPDGEQGPRNAEQAPAEHEVQERRNAVPAAAQHEEDVLGRHEEQVNHHPSVFQAVLFQSLPPRGLRGLPRLLLLPLWTWTFSGPANYRTHLLGSVPPSERHK
jgi:hypothetical protein